MDDYADGVDMTLGDIVKKVNEGKTSEIKPENIAALAKIGNGADMWTLIFLLLLTSVWGGNSSADYWRGKYDAYKELTTPIKEEKDD